MVWLKLSSLSIDLLVDYVVAINWLLIAGWLPIDCKFNNPFQQPLFLKPLLLIQMIEL